MMKTKKELRNEYKQREPRMGIFQIRNLTNGKIYVAKARNLDNIWEGQRFKLDLGGHPSPALCQDWKEFGSENFVFEVLHELKPSTDPAADYRAELAELESMTIEDLQPFGDKGYNRASVTRP